MTCKNTHKKMARFANANNSITEGKLRHNYEELRMVLNCTRRLGDKIPGEKSILTNMKGRYVRKKTYFYIHKKMQALKNR